MNQTLTCNWLGCRRDIVVPGGMEPIGDGDETEMVIKRPVDLAICSRCFSAESIPTDRNPYAVEVEPFFSLTTEAEISVELRVVN